MRNPANDNLGNPPDDWTDLLAVTNYARYLANARARDIIVYRRAGSQRYGITYAMRSDLCTVGDISYQITINYKGDR